MRYFFANIVFFSFLAAVVGSAFNLFFPIVVFFPVPVFSIAVALALSRGFLPALPWAVFFGSISDLSVLGRLGMLAVVCVGLVYTVSFFSRRFVVEHKAATGVFSSLLVAVAALSYPFAAGIFLEGELAVESSLSLNAIAGILILSFVTVFLSRSVMGWFDRWTARLDSETFL